MRSLALIPLCLLLACSGGKDGNDPIDTAADLDQDGDGVTPNQGDCDDSDPAINPNEDDFPCDGIDQDCSGDDLTDLDGDGHGDKACGGDDCDDSDSSIYPDAPDACGDKIDSDCGGELECDCDGDDYDGAQCEGSDCDDTDAAVHPGVTDECYDGVDSDCLGNDDNDCDRDGYLPEEYGGDDCNDADYRINPGEPETCLDGIDNDCSATTDDCDCDGDGFSDPTCGGDDCDDADASVNPDASEADVNDADDDCDGEVDEDAYCNPYSPLSNGATAKRTYDMLFYDGSDYTEEITISSWSSSTGDAVLHRVLTSVFSSYEVDETMSCVGGQVDMKGFTTTVYTYPLSFSYDVARTVFLPESELVEEASWTYDYAAIDDSAGTPAWTAEGVYTVLGVEEITVTAGTFTTLVISNDYALEHLTAPELSREGTVIMYFAPRLGLVYSEDITTDGTTAEVRAMTSYSGFYP